MPIKEVYTFSDWSSVSQMRNVLNPALKLECSAVVDQENNGILGYNLSVFNEKSSEIEYKVKIDSGEEDAWCLTSDEAVAMLNVIGFPCRRTTIELVPDELTVKTLVALKSFGFTQVRRTVRPQDVIAFGKEATNVVLLNDFIETFAYRDWLFLPVGQMVNIDDLIKNYSGDSND